MEMHEALATPRLLLRRFRKEDATAFHEIFKDPEVMRYWSTPPHQDISQTRNWIDRTIASCKRGESDDFIVEHDHRIIGKAGLWRTNELGFLFAREAWGLGLASEAVRAVIYRAFARGITTIAADVDPRNFRALTFLQKLGFNQVGTATATLRVGDTWVDSTYLELHHEPA